MKKPILFFSFLCCLLGFNFLKAQTPSMVVTPQNQCFSASSTTAFAYISPGVPGASSYSWTALSDSCAASITTYSNGSIAYISYSCCGIYTIGAAAFNGTTFVAALIQTVSISCSSNSSITISGPNSTCNGGSIVLSGSGSTSYTWMPGGSHSASIAVTPTASTCYTLFGTVCGGVSAAVKCVSVNPVPIYIIGNQNICAGYTSTLSALGASSYTWYTSQGTYTGSSIVLTPSVTTCYSVIATTSTGCTSYTGGCITVSTGTASPVISGNMNICQGGSTTLYASGASGYTWMPGGSTSSTLSIPSLTTTTCFTLAGQGCSGVSYAVRCVTVGTSPTLAISGNTSICSGSGATITASGASSYTWYTSQGTFTGSTIVLTPTATSCYSLVGQSLSGCYGYSGGCIYVNTPPNPVISGSNFNICAGTSATLYASGASSYTWFPSGVVSSSLAVSPSVTTCYTLAGYSCFNMNYATRCVTVQPAASVSVSAWDPAICSGSFTTLYASGATSYTWLPSNTHSTTLVVTPSVTTCYTLQGASCGGSVSSAVTCVTVNPSPSVTVSGNTTICAGDSTVLSLSGANTYYWYNTGTYASSVVVSPSTTTCYSIIAINNAVGCDVYTVVCVNVSQNNSVSISGPTSICSNSYVILYASGGSNYTWTPGGSTSSSIVVTPTSAACYTLSGTGCAGITSAVRCVTVSSSPTLAVNGGTSICSGSTTTLVASGASSYTWYTSAGTYTGSTIVLSPSATVCYSLMGTNSSGCYGYTGGCVTVLSGTNLSVSGATNICAGMSTTLTAGGAQTYTWFPSGYVGSSIVVSPTATTCYTLVGYSTGPCGGLASKLVCVNINASPVITSSSPFFCAGQSNTLHASGANSYTWYPYNLTGPNVIITPTTSGCYTVVGTSSTGCSGYATGCYSVLPVPTITVSGNNIVCAGAPTTLTAYGAQSYTWYPSNLAGSSIVVNPLSPTCYTVVGSYYGCSSYAVKCLSVQTGPTITAGGTNTFCAGATTTLFANGASSYTWLPGNLSGPIVAVSPSANVCYTVVGTNSNGCIGIGYRCVQLAPNPVIMVTQGGIACAGSPLSLHASGANSYTWTPFNQHDTTIVITPTASGCYTISGTNNYGCTSSAIGCYTVAPSPSVFVTSTSSVICAGGSTTLSAAGASSYTWMPGNLVGASIGVAPSVSTCYTVFASNGGNCISKAVSCVNVQPGAQLYISSSNNICAGTSANLLVSGASSYTWSNGSTSPYITVTPSVNTCYTVVGITSGGCVGSAVKCINVYAAPFITISGPSQICSGSSAFLVASGALSYGWSNGSPSPSIVVSPNATTVYSVNGSNGYCSSTKSYTVVVKPRPTISIFRTDTIFHNDSIICAGNAVHLAAGGASTYTWSNGSNSSYITITPSVTSTYTVSGTSGNGCSNSNVITVYVSACTGMMKNSENLQVDIYPNPSSGNLILQGDGVTKINYSVYDVLGRELLKGEFMDTKDLNLSNYSNGTYTIRFTSGNSVSYKKLILETK